MNPNLQYCDWMPGHSGERGQWSGGITFEFLPRLLDAIGLIKDSGSWTAADDTAWRQWLSELKVWMERPYQPSTGHVGNIKTARDLYYVSIMLYLGDHAKAYDFVSKNTFALFRHQTRNSDPGTTKTTPFGAFWEEWSRVESWGYSTKVLKMWIEWCELVPRIIPPPGMPRLDLWNYKAPSGHSMRAVIDFMFQYVLSKARFGNESNPWDMFMLSPLRIATKRFKTTVNPDWWNLFLKAKHGGFRSGVDGKHEIDDACEIPTVPYDYRYTV